MLTHMVVELESAQPGDLRTCARRGAGLLIAQGKKKKERAGDLISFLGLQVRRKEKKGESPLAPGTKTDVQVSSAIPVMKCKGADSHELLNKTIFHSSNIPFFFSPEHGYLFFPVLAESRQAAEQHGGYCYSFLC